MGQNLTPVNSEIAKTLQGYFQGISGGAESLEEWMFLEDNKHSFPDRKGICKWRCPFCETSFSYRVDRLKTFLQGRKVVGCEKCIKPFKGMNSPSPGNSFEELAPYASKFWNYELNYPLIPENVSRSHKLFHFKCEVCGENYSADLHSSAKTRPRCEECRQFHSVKENESVTSHLSKVDYVWADKRPSETVFYLSNRFFQWKCLKHHEIFSATPQSIFGKDPETGPIRCPVCSGKKIVLGENDFFSKYPEFRERFLHFVDRKTGEKLNSERVLLETLDTGPHLTKTFARWSCSKGHSFRRSLYQVKMVGLNTCSVCQNLEFLEGVNDFATQASPRILKQYSDANHLPPNKVMATDSDEFLFDCPDCKQTYYQNAYNKLVKGYGCPICAGQRVVEGVNDLRTRVPEIENWWNWEKMDFGPESITFAADEILHLTCPSGHEIVNRPYDFKDDLYCFKCNRTTSKAEQEIAYFIQKELGFEIDQGNRTLIKPMEIDIFVPSKMVGFEYNGLYYHSEASKERDYHLNKYKAAKKAGIQLIQIWEDEWLRNKEVTKNLIKAKLGILSKPPIGARKTQIQEVSKADADNLLNQHHIQGTGSFRFLGLTSTEGLEAVIGYSVHGSVLRLDRYASRRMVHGGLMKLLVHAVSYEPEIESVLTFADHTKSDGGLYETLGFTKTRELEPDYSYLVGSERKHKFLYRKDRFQKDPDLKYDPKMTERELAHLNKLYRVYDAGKSVYEIDVI